MPPLLAPVLTLAFCLAVQDRAVDVSVPTLGPPVLVAEIDTSKVKGDARRLAWEPGGTTLYLQTADSPAAGLPGGGRGTRLGWEAGRVTWFEGGCGAAAQRQARVPRGADTTSRQGQTRREVHGRRRSDAV